MPNFMLFKGLLCPIVLLMMKICRVFLKIVQEYPFTILSLNLNGKLNFNKILCAKYFVWMILEKLLYS
jgi:hypothetical protein